MINHAPEFVNPPVIFAGQSRAISYSAGAIDPDGDSLVYSLRSVSPNATYAPGFTYLNPITANPALALNSRKGIITFIPASYNLTAGPGAKENKYSVGLQVDEYRKINGQATKIGTIQRNLLINVINLGNQMPVLTAAQNNLPVAPNTIIDVAPGSTVVMNFSASDPDTWDAVSPATNANTVLSGSTYVVTLAQNPNGGQLTWTPTAAHVREEPYFFNVTAIDDACPYRGSTTQPYAYRVRNVSAIKLNRIASQLFTVYPNPATDQIAFRFLDVKPAKACLYIYNPLGQEIDNVTVPETQKEGQEVKWEKANQFPAGNYLVKFISPNGATQTQKFAKLQ